MRSSFATSIALVIISSAHPSQAALTTYEATLTVGPGAWDHVFQAAESVGLEQYDVPVYALPPGDRFTLRFTVDGSVRVVRRVPADPPLSEYGIFDQSVIAAATLTPWAANLGFGLGTSARALNFAGTGSLLYGSSFNTGSYDYFPFAYLFDVSQIFIGVHGPTYSASSIGLGLDEIYGPLTQGRLSVGFGLLYLSAVSFRIAFDVSDFRIVPSPGTAALLGLAAISSSRRRR